MEAEGSTPAVAEQQIEAAHPEHHLQPQVQAEAMPMEGIPPYEQHMPGNEGHIGHHEAHLLGKLIC